MLKCFKHSTNDFPSIKLKEEIIEIVIKSVAKHSRNSELFPNKVVFDVVCERVKRKNGKKIITISTYQIQEEKK